MHEPAQERIDGPAVEEPCGPEPEPGAIDASDAFWDRLIAEERADEEAGRAATMPAEAEEGPGEAVSFDERVEAILHLVNAAPLHREIYVKLLGFCTQRRTLGEAEDEVGGYPEFPQAALSNYRLVRNLVDAGALDWFELDADGEPLAEVREAGLSPDEADDLVADFAVETSEAGAAAAERMRPERRLEELLDREPQRSGALLDVLTFCQEPHSLGQIADFLEQGGFLDNLRAATGQPLQPSFFVDMLERAGVIEWQGSWRITAGGRFALEQLGRLCA